jgi:peptide chain release factor 3
VAGAEALRTTSDVEVFTRGDGALLALFPTKWRLLSLQRHHPDIRLDPLVAGTE